MDNDELYRKQQEFLSFIRTSEKELKQYQKKIGKYKNNLFNYIVKLSYSYYPETLTESENIIRKEIQFHYTNLIEDLDAILSGFEIESKQLVDYSIHHTTSYLRGQAFGYIFFSPKRKKGCRLNCVALTNTLIIKLELMSNPFCKIPFKKYIYFSKLNKLLIRSFIIKKIRIQNPINSIGF